MAKADRGVAGELLVNPVYHEWRGSLKIIGYLQTWRLGWGLKVEKRRVSILNSSKSNIDKHEVINPVSIV